MTRPPIPTITDKLPISLRAYAAPIRLMTAPSKFKPTRSHVLAASDWTLIFDCETTIDACQRLRFGTYQVRKAGEVRYHGIFYDPDAISEIELINLRNYANRNSSSLLTHTEFVDKIFFRIGYELRATIVGFNLPFDIARIAIRDNPAKGSMRGGFSFTLSSKYWLPRVRIKHLSGKAAFMQFAASPKQRANRGWQQNGAKGKVRRGHFVDCPPSAFNRQTGCIK